MGFSGRLSKLCLGLLAVALLGGACADFRRGPASDAAAETAPSDDPLFENDVYPILQIRCQDCHAPGKEAGLTRLVLTGNAKADRAMVVALVYPDYPDGSLLLQRAAGNQHSGGQRLTPDDPEYLTIRNWIASLPRSP